MLNASKIICLTLAFSALLGACASTSTQYPIIETTEIEADTVAIQSSVIDAVLERKARVDDIAWPLLVSSADLCHNRRRDAFGLTIGNDRTIRSLVDGFNLKQVNAAGYDDRPVVLGVSAGSPAFQAGLRPGAVPIRVGGTDVQGQLDVLTDALGTYAKSRSAAKRAGEDPPALPVVFDQADERLDLVLEPQTICNVQVQVLETSVVNASAGEDRIRINRGLLTYFPDDADIALVVAHEIGHVAGRHVPKLERNATVSGLYLWGVPIAIGAGLLDLTIGGVLERFAGVETPPGAAALTRVQNGVLGIRNFEREADYLSMYIAARAGLDISQVERVFESFSKVSPKSTYGTRSHPVTAERMLALAATRAEIEAKQAAGELLVPNGWPWPIPGALETVED
ncbi:MAG: M48 family metallopeptidase [Pseudomonadota bacterium]